MSLKDYVYLGLIALSALVFYFHGYFAGAIRTRKALKHLLDDSDALLELPEEELFEAAPDRLDSHRAPSPVIEHPIHGWFGRN